MLDSLIKDLHEHGTKSLGLSDARFDVAVVEPLAHADGDQGRRWMREKRVVVSLAP